MTLSPEVSVPNIRDFARIVFFTGAGMSAESGVPTYRGKGGIWKEYDWESYACQEAFDSEPDRVWDFHNYRRGVVGSCAPNKGHLLIAEAEKKLPHIAVVTQNIDGLHQLAGSQTVHELHGSLWRVRCSWCHEKKLDRSVPLADVRCSCGQYWRPDIVWFGDALSQIVLDAVVEAMNDCDLLVSIGTSAVVYPAAQMPLIAKRAGATLVEINPEDTPMSEVFDYRLRGTATEMLTKICAGL
jgi:NAD-dependent deacetylase